MNAPTVQFLQDYAGHRAREGRGYRGEALRSLPYLKSGPLARQWQVRARSFEALVRHVLTPPGRPLEILDLGAGNGWLCRRAALLGHKAIALDIRNDDVDGLGAAAEFLAESPGLFECVTASFADLPFPAAHFDISIFNASLHYAENLSRVLTEATRVTRPGGTLVILDSPFYAREEDGAAMVAEKHWRGRASFGARANSLLAPGFIEYLTRARLLQAAPGLHWVRQRVRYPLWYEVRPLLAKLRRARAPSRFDLWTATVP